VAGSYDDLVKRANGQPTETVDPVLQGRNQEISKSLQANMYAARDKEPGRVIEALQISERQKIPAAFVEKNLEAVKKQSASRKYDYNDLVNRSRGTAKFLQDPMNAAAAKDDVSVLQDVETNVARFKPYKAEEITIHKEYGRAAKGGLKQLESSIYLLGAAYGKISPEIAAEAVSESFRKQQEIRDQAPSYVKEFRSLVEKNKGDLNKSWDQLTSSYDEYKKGNILNALKQFGMGGGNTIADGFDAISDLITEPRAIGYMTIESLANSFPSLVTGGAGAAAGFASPIPGGAAIGLMGGTFAGSVGVEIGSTIQEELASRNIDVNDPAAVASVLKNPDIMANIKSRAERKGITTAAIDSIFSLFAGQIASKAGKGVLKKTAAGLADVGIQAVGETASELGGQIAKEKSLKVDFTEALVEGLTSIGHAVGETGLGVTKNVAAGVREKYSKRTEKAAEQVVEETVKSIKTIKDLEAIDNARLKIRESKNIKDVPSKVKELVDTVTGGDEGAAAYFQIDDFNNYWNRKGKSPVEAAAELMGDGGKAYQEAVASGQLMEMSVGQLIAQTATNKDMDDLITITRVGVDGMTLAEARESFKNLPGIMESLASEAIGDQGVTDAGPQVDQEAEARSIGKDVETQLMASGMKQGEARTYAKVYESAFNAIAERSGKSARELYDQYQLRIRGPEQIKLEAGTSVLPDQQVLEQTAQLKPEQVGPVVSPIGFYSQVEAEISKMDFKQMPAKDLSNRIKNIQGLKKEELEFLGLNEWLDARDGKVTKEEVVEFIKNNGVQVEQIVLSEGFEQEGTSLGDIKFGEQERVDLDDRYLTQENINSEAENTLYDPESSFGEETLAEWRAEIVAKNTDSDGNVDEQAVEREYEQKLSDEADARAEEYVKSDDYFGARYRVEIESDSDLYLEGSDEYGWSDPDGKDYGSNLEEAKIQYLSKLLDDGVIEGDVTELSKAKDLSWGSPTAAVAPTEATLKKRIKKLIETKRDEYLKIARERYPDEFKGTPEEIAQAEKSNLNFLAGQEAEEYYNDPANPRNTVSVSIRHPVLSGKIVGNDKNGYELKYESPTVTNNTYILESKNIEDAKAEALKKMIEVGDLKEDAAPTGDGQADPNTPTGKSNWQKYTAPGEKENYREILLTLPKTKDDFTYDTHFRGQKNFVAHVRLTDRIDANGKKVLFVEELQSDWHQQGRERGYKTKLKDSDLPESIKPLAAEIRNIGITKPLDEISVDDVSDAGGSEELKDKLRQAISDNEILRREDAVPDAPFKNTETWAALAMKRVIRLAVEQGYDRVAWTPADIHVERWGTDEVSWVKQDAVDVSGWSVKKKSDESWAVIGDDGKIIDKSGRPLKGNAGWGYDTEAQAKAALEDFKVKLSSSGWLVGATEQRGGNADGVNIEELARQRGELLSRDGERVTTEQELRSVIASTLGREKKDRSLDSITERIWKQMQGADNNITGQVKPRQEGMEFFYNKLIPKTVEKIVKKLDKNAKVEPIKIVTDPDYKINSAEGLVSDDNTTVLSIPITDEMKVKTSQGFELFQEGAKGKIRFGSDRQFNIDLLEKADPSTFLHETGHFFLEVLGDMAAMPDANDQVKADYKAILDWFGVESRDQIKTEQHEMFARGFESYLMEGKAPSVGLKKAFRRFKQWLIAVYRQMRNLNVTLTPEVRDVFNRMLATEAEIQEATDSYNFEPMFSDPSAFGFTGKKAEKYLMAVDEAKMAAEEQMLAKVMDGYARKKRVEYKNRRKAVLAEVEAQVDQMPQYKVLALLQRGTKPDGSPLDEGTQAIKLDRQALIDAYGAEFVKNKLPRPYIYAREGGVNHDVVASMFGFESGDDMITQIVNLPPRKQFVDRLTDQRMTTEFPDLLADDEQLEAEALNAIHSEKRAELLRLELDFLWDNYQGLAKDVIRKTIRRTPPQAFIKEQAQKILGSKMMGRVRPLAFLAAEKKAAKEAATSLMKGDFETAYTAKEKELLNHELYKEALRLKEQTKKNLDLFKKFFKKDEDLAKSRDLNFVNAGRAVLASYGIGKQDRTAAEYLEELRRYDPEGYETIKALVDDAVLDAGPYKTVTADKFLEMSDAVKGLWDLSKTSKEIVIEGRKIDKQKAVDELTATIEQIGRPKSMVGYNKKATDWEKFKVRLSSFGAILRRVEQWADTMDMGETTGAFKTYIFNPIAESTSKYRIAKKDLIKKYLEMVKAVEKTITREPIKSTELNYEFKGKQELLGALLHVGNESNKAKLLLGRGWATLNADGTLNTSSWDKFVKRMHDTGVLVKADWDFLQNVWGLFEETKTEAQKAHYDMYGFYFNEITANEITTPFGTYKGGYAPAIPDSDLVQDQAIRNDQEQLEKMGNSFMFPTAGKGFTKKRIENYTVPLIMDLGMVPRHIDKVTRFTYIEPRVKDVAKLVFDRKFRKTLDDFDKSIASDMLVPWLQRSARQQVEIPSTGGFRFLDATFKTLRRNTGLNIMTGNVLNTLQQVTGLSIGALEVKHSNLRNALWSYVKAPKQYAADVASKSQFMETRVTTSVIEINNHIDELLLNPSKYEQLRDFAQKHGYFLQSSAQNVVDVIVWGGRYDQAVAEGLSEVDAVRAADRAVRATQGSFNPEDMSAFEVGSPMFRAFTMFYSYFNMQANVLTSKVQQTFYEMGLKKGAGRLMYIYLFGFMVPAIVSEAIMRAGGGDWDEDDDGEYMDDMMSIFFLSQFRTMSAFAPYVGQAANSAVNVWNEKPYDDRISVSPAIGALETSVRAPVSVYEAIVEDGSKKKAVKDMLTVLGLVTGVPVAPLGKPLGYMIDVSEGDANPTGPIDFTRGLITGRPGDN
jgi:Large polyvalent protein associated domain 22